LAREWSYYYYIIIVIKTKIHRRVFASYTKLWIGHSPLYSCVQNGKEI